MAERGTKLQPKLGIMDVITRLEAITGSATKLPLTRRAVINPREMQDLITQLRHSLPADINEALQIIRYRDTLISQAQTEAARVKAESEQEALQKISETQIVKDAQVMAENIKSEAHRQQQALLSDAEQQATSRVNGADTYALDVLARLEEELSTLLSTARGGIESLKEGRVLEDKRS